MRALLQSLNNGQLTLADVPTPKLNKGGILIETMQTLISPGTERMLLDFGKASFIQKARQQPDKVKQTLEKVKTDGLPATLDAVLNKLNQPLALGYCNVGKIIEICPSVRGFEVGNRVICNGGHAEIVGSVPNLCAVVPENVDDDNAVFTVLGAISLQGIRLLRPTLGETVAVFGLGLVGQLAVQLLRAHGCRVIAFDYDSERLHATGEMGAKVIDLNSCDDPVTEALNFSRLKGVDAVLLATTTKSNAPIRQAASMCRKRGRVVLVGTTGLNLAREDFYDKEISFQVSCSYGPGRYDPDYEEKGFDYPIGFVRWTEKRNFEAFLDAISEGYLDTAPLISHRFAIEDYESAYRIVSEGHSSSGIILTYSKDQIQKRDRSIALRTNLSSSHVGKRKIASLSVGFIGAGAYASRVLLPAFAKTKTRFTSICSQGGISAVNQGKKYKFETATSDFQSILTDDKTEAVVIATQHDSHADLVRQFLSVGKHVFVEKPLCVNESQLLQLREAMAEMGEACPMLTVGFNRRFSPHITKMRSLMTRSDEPKSIIVTVNAGHIESNHWSQNLEKGGGRIIGEVCHFVDLLRFLVGQKITGINRATIPSKSNDTTSITISFVDGSIGTIHYFANGNKALHKERVEVYVGGKVLHLENYRKLIGYGWRDFRQETTFKLDKGQSSCVKAFVEAVVGNGRPPIPIDELFEVADATIKIADM